MEKEVSQGKKDINHNFYGFLTHKRAYSSIEEKLPSFYLMNQRLRDCCFLKVPLVCILCFLGFKNQPFSSVSWFVALLVEPGCVDGLSVVVFGPGSVEIGPEVRLQRRI